MRNVHTFIAKKTFRLIILYFLIIIIIGGLTDKDWWSVYHQLGTPETASTSSHLHPPTKSITDVVKKRNNGRRYKFYSKWGKGMQGDRDAYKEEYTY